MCSDYDNPYGMSDQEFEYRAMNPQDPMYMGDSYKAPYSVDNQTSSNKKSSKANPKNQPQSQTPQEEHVCKDIPEVLFVVICLLLVGLFIFGVLWLMAY